MSSTESPSVDHDTFTHHPFPPIPLTDRPDRPPVSMEQQRSDDTTTSSSQPMAALDTDGSGARPASDKQVSQSQWDVTAKVFTERPLQHLFSQQNSSGADVSTAASQAISLTSAGANTPGWSPEVQEILDSMDDLDDKERLAEFSRTLAAYTKSTTSSLPSDVGSEISQAVSYMSQYGLASGPHGSTLSGCDPTPWAYDIGEDHINDRHLEARTTWGLPARMSSDNWRQIALELQAHPETPDTWWHEKYGEATLYDLDGRKPGDPLTHRLGFYVLANPSDYPESDPRKVEWRKLCFSETSSEFKTRVVGARDQRMIKKKISKDLPSSTTLKDMVAARQAKTSSSHGLRLNAGILSEHEARMTAQDIQQSKRSPSLDST